MMAEKANIRREENQALLVRTLPIPSNASGSV
jgi:hypothetical protein